MEEEIDLRQYVLILLRHWKWILGLAAIAAIITFGVSLLLPKTYESQAAVATVRSRTEVTFDPRIVTLSEDELAQGRVVDLTSRRQALLALLTSTDVAAQVLEEVGDQLEPDEQNVPDLLEMVKASNKGDLFLITVQYRNPITAALIANVWAQSYEQHVNTLYGGVSESDATVAVQTVAAQKAYEQAQAALEAFLKDNRMATLQREIATRQGLLDAYQNARGAMLKQPVDLQLSLAQQKLGDYYDDLRKIERWLADARALRAQVMAASGSAAADVGNALALIALRSQALGGAGALPLQVQVDLAAGQGGVQPADVDALIQVLEKRRRETQEQIDGLTASLANQQPEEVTIAADSALNVRVADLDAEIRALQAELESQQAQQRELTRARDLAWDTYQTLARKQAEVGIASQVTGTEVRVAASAVPAEKPARPRKLLNAAIAGVLGLMVGVFGAFAVEWWRGAGHGDTETRRCGDAEAGQAG